MDAKNKEEKKMDLKFFINRIRRMSPAEILFRIKQIIQKKLEQRFLRFYHIKPTYNDFYHPSLNLDFNYLKIGLLLKQADKLCDNKIDILSLKDCNIGIKIDYHKDYKSGLSAPINKFGKNIDYRDSKMIGDIKYIWELNRHLFLIPLAFAFKVSGKQRYLDKFKYFLSTWLDQNQFMYGINWNSSLEPGIRLINWTFCWHILRDKIDDQYKTKWLESIYKHCWFINRNFSSYSSANNHLIGEAAGLFIASTALPPFNQSYKWQNKSLKILIKECKSQNYKDGVNKEQAISYQQFTLDFFLLAGLIGKNYNIDFPENYWDILEKMIEYIAALEDVKGNIPQIGDEDDAMVIDLGQHEYGIYRSLLNTGAYIFKRKALLKNSNTSKIDLKTRFILSISNLNTSIHFKTDEPIPHQFPEGGYYILGINFNKNHEQKLIFDCGPLGYLSIAAHGHADALSFSFTANGYPIFIDSGTYAYHANKEWRNYFRGTSAHNTLTIDEKNQSVIVGNFMWTKNAEAKLLDYKETYYIKGTHNGYLKLKDPAIHNRTIIYNKLKNCWEITDEILSFGKHKIDIYFQCSPLCKVSLTDKYINIKFPGGICKLKYDSGITVSLHAGEIDPIIGWYSPSYDIKKPITTIKLSKNITNNAIINCEFEILFK